MTGRARRCLQVAVAVGCVAIMVSTLMGTGLEATAEGQAFDYPPDPPTPPPTAQPGQPRSVPGVNNRVRPVDVPGFAGDPLVCKRPNEDCVPLTGDSVVPIGAYLDTSKGALRLETRRAGGTYTGMTVYAGVFQLQQARGRNTLLVAKIAGRLPQNCRRTTRRRSVLRAQSSKAKKQSRRRLWSNGKGRFRTTGRYGTATVRGTKWLIEERCAGTYVRVASGRVEVRDKRRGRTVFVTKRRSYLIRR